MSGKRKPGRPKLPRGESRSRVLSVRLTAGERVEIDRLARQEGASASDWAHDALLQVLHSKSRP